MILYDILQTSFLNAQIYKFIYPLSDCCRLAFHSLYPHPPHFLMQVNSYKDLGPSFCSSSYYRLNTWMTQTPASPSLSRSRS